MIESSETIGDADAGALVCDVCEGPAGGGSYVQAFERSLILFCSEDCFDFAAEEERAARREARRGSARRLFLGIIFVGAFVTPHERAPPPGPPRVHRAPPLPPANDAGPGQLPPGWFGPVWPPTEESLLAALGRDTWIHPLAGPIRRMPRSDSRVFGAVRPGDRAVECRNGHCGVDLGGEIWGEHVHAVHDGVVDFVQRGANPDHGGRFVRLSHRNGTLFTQYFHLAAIPRGLERGRGVRGGQVIGLLGDSGVKESGPHLHFTISRRPYKDGPEKYIDPEPLIALWPLRVPLDGSEVGLVTTLADPGIPLGSALLKPGHKRKSANQKRDPDKPASSDPHPSADQDAPGPSDEEPASEPATPEMPTGE